MRIAPLSDVLGAEITGIDVARDLDGEAFDAVLNAFHRYRVLAFREQYLEPADQVAFASRFGPLEVHDNRQYNLPDNAHVMVLSNDLRDGEPVGVPDAGDSWHTDLSFKETPSLCTLLQAVRLPREGGDTAFACMTRAYAALPPDIKARIEGRRAIHNPSKLVNPRVEISPLRKDAAAFYAGQSARFAEVSHPIVRTHPATGEKSLYVQPRFTVGIEGMDDDEAQPLLDLLFAHQIRPEFVYLNKWREGDLLMWDNRCVIHYATGGYAWPDIRTMHRTTVLGDRPY